MSEINDPELMDYYYKKIVNNEDVMKANGRLWSLSLDQQLREQVVLYNFNFKIVSENLQNFQNIDNIEEEIKRHWAFLHSARHIHLLVNEDYYKSMRDKYPEEKPSFSNEEEILIKELEEKKRIEIESYKYVKERFNLISLDENPKKTITESQLNSNEEENDLKSEENIENLLITKDSTINKEIKSLNEEISLNNQDFKNQENIPIDNSIKEIDDLFENAKKLKLEELRSLNGNKLSIIIDLI